VETGAAVDVHTLAARMLVAEDAQTSAAHATTCEARQEIARVDITTSAAHLSAGRLLMLSACGAQPRLRRLPLRLGHDPPRLLMTRQPIALRAARPVHLAPPIPFPCPVPDHVTSIERPTQHFGDRRRRPPRWPAQVRLRRGRALRVQLLRH